MPFLGKTSLKVDSLGAIIGFAASKQPINPKFKLNLKEQVLSCESHSATFVKDEEPNNKDRLSNARPRRVPSLLI